MLELYHSGLSTCSKQARITLNEKGLDYVSHYVELQHHGQLAEDYLKLNPWGVVPTLVHDGIPVINTAAINEYLDDVFPDPPLRPADPRARARMRLWTYVADNIHPAMANATYNDHLRARMTSLSQADIDLILSRMPAPERRERVRRILAGGFDGSEMALVYERLGFVMGRMEAALADGTWLAGDDYSLGDISMHAIIHRATELRPEIVTGGEWPRVADWWQRISDRPAVRKVMQEGTDETPARPAQHSVSGMV